MYKFRKFKRLIWKKTENGQFYSIVNYLLKLFPKEITDEEKIEQKDFTRKKVLSFTIIIIIIINLVKDRNTKGYDITMNLFWSQSKKNKIELPTDFPPTSSAFSQARKKVKADSIKKMFISSKDRFEESYKDKYLWKGFRVFAVDGTKYTLPAEKELIEKFGCQNCGEKDAHYPQALVSVLFNVKSKIAYDVVIEDVKGNEREQLKTLCNSLSENDLIILDRGYPSYEIFKYLLKKKVDFLIRINCKNTYKFVEEFLKSNLNEQILEINVPNTNEYIKLRVLKSKNKNGEIRIFVTSLLAQDKYSYQEIVDLYYERWEIEEHYKKNKELFKVENFHSKKENGILQEIYAQLLLSNLTKIMMNEAEKDNKNKEGEPSFKNAVYVVENYINEMSLCENIEKINLLIPNMLQEISRVRYIKRKNRHFERKSYKLVSKWTRKK